MENYIMITHTIKTPFCNKPNTESNFVKQNQIGDMPEWNLSDLYSSPKAREINRDLKKVQNLCHAFAVNYKNNLSKLSASEMLDCLKAQEKINGLMGRLMSYASLRYYKKTSDNSRTKFLSDIQDKITEFSSKLIFIRIA